MALGKLQEGFSRRHGFAFLAFVPPAGYEGLGLARRWWFNGGSLPVGGPAVLGGL